MDIFTQVIIQYVAEILGLLIISVIGVLGAMLLKKLNENNKLSNISKATEVVLEATCTTVHRLQQTLVEDWKAAAQNGKLTPEQIDELKQKVIELTLEQLGEPVLDLLAAAKVDVEAMITNQAEGYIDQLRDKTKIIDQLMGEGI